MQHAVFLTRFCNTWKGWGVQEQAFASQFGTSAQLKSVKGISLFFLLLWDFFGHRQEVDVAFIIWLLNLKYKGNFVTEENGYLESSMFVIPTNLLTTLHE